MISSHVRALGRVDGLEKLVVIVDVPPECW